MGNFEANENGEIKESKFINEMKLYGHTNVAGRSIVFHAGEDDLGQGRIGVWGGVNCCIGGDEGSLASGNSGARLAC